MPVEQLCQPSDVLNAWPAFGALPAPEQAELINVASQKILNFCRRDLFLAATVTENLSGNGLSRLWLKNRPVISVNAITLNGWDVVDNSTGYGWSFSPKKGELRLGTGFDDLRFSRKFPHGRNNVAVQYWAGYSAVPDPVIRATIWAVRWLSDQMKISGIYSSERIGDYSYTINAAALTLTLPVHIQALLAEYVQDDGPL